MLIYMIRLVDMVCAIMPAFYYFIFDFSLAYQFLFLVQVQ